MNPTWKDDARTFQNEMTNQKKQEITFHSRAGQRRIITQGYKYDWTFPPKSDHTWSWNGTHHHRREARRDWTNAHLHEWSTVRYVWQRFTWTSYSTYVLLHVMVTAWSTKVLHVFCSLWFTESTRLFERRT